MRRPIEPLMRCIVTLGMLLALLAAAWTPPAHASDEVQTVRGAVGWVSPDSVEVGGRRALLTTETSIMSDGRPISIGSVVVDMPAELEFDSAGRALELRVKGAVE